MKTFLVAASALALSTPALAQMEPETPTSATTKRSTVTTAPSAQTAGQPATTTRETTTTSVTPADPKALIASEFPTPDKDGSLVPDKAEFMTWMITLKAKSGEKPLSPTELAAWVSGAFTATDKDQSKTITLAELQAYLTKGA